jgi:hypothetical protein
MVASIFASFVLREEMAVLLEVRPTIMDAIIGAHMVFTHPKTLHKMFKIWLMNTLATAGHLNTYLISKNSIQGGGQYTFLLSFLGIFKPKIPSN